MVNSFAQVTMTEEFTFLPFNDVEGLISSNQLNVTSEECVFDAVMRWVKHDLKNREQHLGTLLGHVRLPLTKRAFLLKNVSDEPLIQGNQHAKDLLIEAMKVMDKETRNVAISKCAICVSRSSI